MGHEYPNLASSIPSNPNPRRLSTSVWNPRVLLRELRDLDYTILKDYLHPQC